MRSKAAYRSVRAVKAHRALAEFAARHDLAFQPLIEMDALAHRKLAARPHQRLPVAAVPRHAGAAGRPPPCRSGARAVWDCSCPPAARGVPARWPNSRAGKTRESLATRQSPGLQVFGQVAERRGPPSGLPARCTTSMRAAARSASASCAIAPPAGGNRNRPVASSLHCSGNRSSCSSSAHSSGRYSILPEARP